MTTRTPLAVLVLSLLALTTGCSSDSEPEIIRPSEAVLPPPAYDDTLEPSAAVLAIVPADATVVEVTDYDQVRFALGYGDLSSRSDQTVRARFWRQAEKESPLLSPGILRQAGSSSTARLGFTQDDVAWEAHFTGPAGDGYVVKFHDDVAMARVQRAAAADRGPLAGAVVVPLARIAAVGATREPEQSWAAEPDLVALAGQKAGATYLSRDCLTAAEAFGDGSDDLAPTPAADLDELDDLGGFSVAFGGRLVTARLGAPRTDVFERARLAGTMPATDPDFGTGYATPVADPAGGRIGFRLVDGPVAARLAHERQLPFAVCGQ